MARRMQLAEVQPEIELSQRQITPTNSTIQSSIKFLGAAMEKLDGAKMSRQARSLKVEVQRIMETSRTLVDEIEAAYSEPDKTQTLRDSHEAFYESLICYRDSVVYDLVESPQENQENQEKKIDRPNECGSKQGWNKPPPSVSGSTNMPTLQEDAGGIEQKFENGEDLHFVDEPKQAPGPAPIPPPKPSKKKKTVIKRVPKRPKPEVEEAKINQEAPSTKVTHQGVPGEMSMSSATEAGDQAQNTLLETIVPIEDDMFDCKSLKEFLVADSESLLDESKTDDSDQESLDEFEQSNASLLYLFQRKCCIFTGPQHYLGLPLEHPTEFTRVCDDQTFVSFSEATGFVNEQRFKLGCIDFPTWPFIDATSVINHMDFRGRDNTSLTRYISLCGSTEKLRRELLWRQCSRNARQNIRTYSISASNMSYKEIFLGANMSILCLHKRVRGTVYDEHSRQLIQRLMDVVFVNAKQLIDKLNIRHDVSDKAYNTCSEEWLAVQRIPPEMIQAQTQR